MNYFKWNEVQPPDSTWVWARYRESEDWQLYKTCKRGCCVYSAFGTQILPKDWYLAKPEEGIKEQARWEKMPEINIFNLF